MVRDEEIQRLIKYAEGMGLKVVFKPYIRNETPEAEYLIDGTQITIYLKSRYSKIEKILSLIHEISHHKAFINNSREEDPKIEEALLSEESTKRFNKRILNMEIKDSQHWEEIYRDTNCKFNIDKLYKQREFDIWYYQVKYETGKRPTKVDKINKKKELRIKYGV